MLNFNYILEDSAILYSLIAALLLMIYQILFKIYLRKKLRKCKKNNFNTSTPPVSIVICTKEDLGAMYDSLSNLLSQDYPDFEIVIVNVISKETDDDTEPWIKNNPKITYITVNERNNFFYSKIFPLAVGVKSAKNDIIITTDLHFRPASELWIRIMVAALSNKVTNVAGLSSCKHKNSFFNKLIHYESTLFNINTCTYIKAFGSYNVSPNNYAFMKRDFLDNENIHNYFSVATDGNAVFRHFINKKNTEIVIDSNAHTIDEKDYTFSSWIAAITNRDSNHRFIKPTVKFKQIFFNISTFLFIIFIVFACIYSNLNIPTILICSFLLITRFISWFILTKKNITDVEQRRASSNIIVYEAIMILLRPYLFLKSIIVKKNLWI